MPEHLLSLYEVELYLGPGFFALPLNQIYFIFYIIQQCVN